MGIGRFKAACLSSFEPSHEHSSNPTVKNLIWDPSRRSLLKDVSNEITVPRCPPKLVFGLFRSVQVPLGSVFGQCWERLGRVIEGHGWLLGASKPHLGAILNLLMSILATQR